MVVFEFEVGTLFEVKKVIVFELVVVAEAVAEVESEVFEVED